MSDAPRKMVGVLLVAIAAATGCSGSEGESPSIDAGEASSSTTSATSESPLTTEQTATTVTEVSADPVPTGTGEFHEFEPPAGTELDHVQVTTDDGDFLELRPDACIIVRNLDTDDSVGSIYGPNFGLRWDSEDGEFDLGWGYEGNQLAGPVEAVVEGDIVTFEGEIDGIGVRGSAYCYEGIG